MSEDAMSKFTIETHIAGEEVRVTVGRSSHELGTLVIDPQAIYWVPEEKQDKVTATSQQTWLILWEQFAQMMQKADLRNVLRPTDAAYISTHRVGQKTVHENPRFNTPLPRLREKLPFRRAFSAIETSLVRKGFVFQHWLGSFDSKASEFRIYRGPCIYTLKLRKRAEGCEITEAWVNRDPEQYGRTELEKDCEIVSWLIDVPVLGQEREFPNISAL
jgi:hypothetical protein